MDDGAGPFRWSDSWRRFVAISLLVTEPVSVLEPYWNLIDRVTIVGTPMGTKGTSMQASIFATTREARGH